MPGAVPFTSTYALTNATAPLPGRAGPPRRRRGRPARPGAGPRASTPPAARSPTRRWPRPSARPGTRWPRRWAPAEPGRRDHADERSARWAPDDGACRGGVAPRWWATMRAASRRQREARHTTWADRGAGQHRCRSTTSTRPSSASSRSTAACPTPSSARRSGLSQAAVRQRVQRLIESGVMQVVAVTDPLMVGFSLQAMIGVRAEGDLRARGRAAERGARGRLRGDHLGRLRPAGRGRVRGHRGAARPAQRRHPHHARASPPPTPSPTCTSRSRPTAGAPASGAMGDASRDAAGAGRAAAAAGRAPGAGGPARASSRPSEWQTTTACPGWTVKDIALHLLDDELAWLSRGRDGDLSGLIDDTDRLPRVRGAAGEQEPALGRRRRRVEPAGDHRPAAWSGPSSTPTSPRHRPARRPAR